MNSECETSDFWALRRLSGLCACWDEVLAESKMVSVWFGLVPCTNSPRAGDAGAVRSGGVHAGRFETMGQVLGRSCRWAIEIGYRDWPPARPKVAFFRAYATPDRNAASKTDSYCSINLHFG